MDGKIKIDPTTYAYIGAFKAWYRLKYGKEYDLQENEKEVFYKIRKMVLFEDFNNFLAKSRDCDYKNISDVALGVAIYNGTKKIGYGIL